MEDIKKVTSIEELEELITDEHKEKYREEFDRNARYQGNGVYSWHTIYSTNIRDLFLLGIAARLNILVVYKHDED